MEQAYSNLTDKEKFVLYRWAYSVGKPIITDAEYTSLLNYMQAAFPDDEYVQRSWSSDPCPKDLLRKVDREDLICEVVLADKTESIPSLNTDWEVKNELGNISGIGTLSMKHDGWNIQANYYMGQLVSINTRGRSSDAIDVSALEEYVPKTIPADGKCKVVLELTISKENFKTCARLFNNVSERSAVSTILARPEYYHLLSFHAFDIHGLYLTKCKFEVLKEWGFETPTYFNVHDYAELLAALAELSALEPDYQFPTDGAVYDGELRRAIRLLAWEEPIYYSFVVGYLEKFKTHRISPSILIHPILRKGTTQRQVSMTNWQRIIDYNLQIGAPVAFRIASSATADFDEEATRLLHKQWEGRWEEYCKMIKDNEEINRCQRQMYLNGYV